MTLTVFIDFKSAGSLLAIDPTLALAKRLGLKINWRGFGSEARDIPQEGADQAVIHSHQRVREASMRAIHQKYARLRGIDLRFPESEICTDLALGALAQIDGDRLGFIRTAFDAYWQHHRDLDDPAVVSDLLAQSGVGHSGDVSATRAAFAAEQAVAEAAGVVDAPAYLIKDELFIGRQHLPWIEEIARGGEPPRRRRG